MIRDLTKEVLNGVVRVVENITYTNGRKIKRVLNNRTGVPEEIITVSEGNVLSTQSRIALSLSALFTE